MKSTRSVAPCIGLWDRADPLSPGRRRPSRPSSGSPRPATRSRRRTKSSRSLQGMDRRAALRQPARRPPAQVAGIPTPKDVLGYHIGAPQQADLLRRHPQVLPRARRSDAAREGRDDRQVRRGPRAGRRLGLVGREHQEPAAEPRQPREARRPARAADAQIKQLIATTKPHYHLMGGLHSGETGPSEMLMELVYRLATETSPFISQIRDNVYVSVTPVADAGRTRSQRRLVLSRESEPTASERRAAGGWRRRWWRAAAVLGQVRRSTTTTATSTCRR